MPLENAQDSDPTTIAIRELITENTIIEKIPNLKTYSTSPPSTKDNADSRAFDPDRIFYSTETAAYHVDVGSHYRAYGRKMPVKSGIRRHLERQGISTNDIKELTEVALEDIELDNAVDWVGALAGHRRGLMERNGRSFLITEEPKIPDSIQGDFPLHQAIIDQAFPDADACAVSKGGLPGVWPRSDTRPTNRLQCW